MALSDSILALSPLLYVRQVDGVDHSGNGHNLTPFNSPTAGASLDLSDAGDPSIHLADGNNLWNPEHYAAFDLTDVASLFFLFDAATVGTSSRDLVRKEHIYGTTLNADGKVHAVVRTGGVDHDLTGATTIVAGTTYSVGYSYDGTTLKLYVNGVLDASVAVSGAMDVISSASFTIGTSGVGGYLGIAGDVDEVALFHSVLSGANFAALHSLAATSTTVTPHYSGGSGNGDGALSLGGVEGVALGPLFGAPSNAQRIAGLTDYRCIYLHGTGEAITGLTAWLASGSTQTDSAEAIGTDPSNPAQTIATPTSAPSSVTFSAPATQGAGISLGGLSAGQAKPLWIRRQLDAGAAAGERDFQIGVAWTDAGSVGHTATISLSYLVVKPVTLYVDADSSARSDAWTRAAAADDPTKPFATMQAAAMLLQAGDTLQVEPSTFGNANPTDPHDPDVYAGIIHDPGVPANNIPGALNSGREPINVVGHVVSAGSYPRAGVRSGTRPKALLLEFTRLENWYFEGFQRGYDRGSGYEGNHVNLLHGCRDLTFRDILSTGGAWYAPGNAGTILWDQCTTYSPFTGSSGFLDGVGFHVLAEDTSTGVINDVTYSFTHCWFEDVGGEDAIQAPLNSASDSNLYVADCTFKNIGQSEVPGAAHADAIQPLGANVVTVLRCLFIDVASMFIASDGHFNRLVLIDNIMVPGTLGISGNGIQGQGADVWVIAHNTVRSFGFSVTIGNRLGPTFHQKLYAVNNLIDSFNIDSDTIPLVDAASVFSNNEIIQQSWGTTTWGNNISGLPELGPSARLAGVGVSNSLELANDPVASIGIGAGRSLSGLPLTSDEVAYAAADFFGRAFATPRDVGALQSASGTAITPAARPPYLTNNVPAGGATAPLDTGVTFKLLPVPGQTIDATTVSSTTVYVADDATGTKIPALVTLGAPDSGGAQLVSLDLKASLSPLIEGTLWRRVLYDVVVNGIKDTEGSFVVPTSWQFHAGGASGPAIDGPTHGLGGVRRWTGSDWHLSGS